MSRVDSAPGLTGSGRSSHAFRFSRSSPRSRLALVAGILGGMRGEPVRSWSARPRTRAKQRDLLASDAKMSLARLAGFDTIRITAIWSPGQREISGYDLLGLTNAADAARQSTASGLRLRLSVRLEGHAARGRRHASQFAVLRRVDPAPRPVRPRRDRRQRAEPRTASGCPSSPTKGFDAAAASYLGLLAQTYDALKAVSPDVDRDRRLGLAPRRRRPARSTSADALPDGVHPRPRAGVPAERPHAAGDGLVRLPSLPRDARKLPPTFAHPRTTTIAIADYDKLVALLGEGVRRHGASGARRCRSSTTSSACRPRPGR